MNRKTFLLMADAADGNGNETQNADGAPPMSETAVTGTKTEREIKLETELANERARADEAEKQRKQRELDLAQQVDKHERYRQTVEGANTAPKKFTLPTVLD